MDPHFVSDIPLTYILSVSNTALRSRSRTALKLPESAIRRRSLTTLAVSELLKIQNPGSAAIFICPYNKRVQATINYVRNMHANIQQFLSIVRKQSNWQDNMLYFFTNCKNSGGNKAGKTVNSNCVIFYGRGKIQYLAIAC